MPRTSYFQQMARVKSRETTLNPPPAILRRWEVAELLNLPEASTASAPSNNVSTAAHSAPHSNAPRSLRNDTTATSFSQKPRVLMPETNATPQENSAQRDERKANRQGAERSASVRSLDKPLSSTPSRIVETPAPPIQAAPSRPPLNEQAKRREEQRTDNIIEPDNKHAPRASATQQPELNETGNLEKRVDATSTRLEKPTNKIERDSAVEKNTQKIVQPLTAQAMLVPPAPSTPALPTRKPDKQHAPTIQIGHIEVRVSPPAPPPVAPVQQPARAATTERLSRGFTSSYGMRQG